MVPSVEYYLQCEQKREMRAIGQFTNDSRQIIK